MREYEIEGQPLEENHGIQGLAFDRDGLLYALDRSADPRVLVLDPATGRQRVYARFRDVPPCSGEPDGECSATRLDGPAGPDYATFAPNGDLYVTDIDQALIWRVPKGGGRADIWLTDPRLREPLRAERDPVHGRRAHAAVREHGVEPGRGQLRDRPPLHGAGPARRQPGRGDTGVGEPPARRARRPRDRALGQRLRRARRDQPGGPALARVRRAGAHAAGPGGERAGGGPDGRPGQPRVPGRAAARVEPLGDPRRPEQLGDPRRLRRRGRPAAPLPADLPADAAAEGADRSQRQARPRPRDAPSGLARGPGAAGRGYGPAASARGRTGAGGPPCRSRGGPSRPSRSGRGSAASSAPRWCSETRPNSRSHGGESVRFASYIRVLTSRGKA